MNPPLRPYPETRDSGAAWLGRVPTHWAVRRLKSAFENVVALAPASQVRGPQIALEDVESWTGAVCVEDSSRRLSGQLKQFRRDDILFGKLRPYLAKVATASEVGACVGEFLVLRRRIAGGATPYFESLLRSSDFIAVVNGTVAGAKMPRAEWPSVGAFPIPVPPLAEQRSIARFLDHSCRRIGRYLAAKERLIELLEEQKQAVIRRAVTRGLDPAVPHKPSGIEWLGDIPAHWEVIRVGRLFQQRNAPAATHLPILEVSLKTGVRVRQFDASHRKQVMSDRGSYQRAEKGDLTYNMMRMWQGAVGVVPCDGLVSPAYVVAKPVSDADSRYFAPLFRTPEYRAGINGSSRGIVKDRNRLYWQDFKSIPALRPPAAEQQAIVAHLDRATAALDAAIARTRRQRELVAEYRTRLVADVATGKLDAREAARRLPADPDDGDGARA